MRGKERRVSGKLLLLGAVLVLVFFGGPVWADEVALEGNIGVTLTSDPVGMITFSEAVTIPMLRAENPLMAGNNLKVNLGGNVTPVSVNGTLEAVLTPLALLQVIGGGAVGSGWDLPALGIDHGTGLIFPQAANAEGKTFRIDGTPFDGAVWRAYGALLVQFDFGLLIPGDWGHILFQSRQQIGYSAYSRATTGLQAWTYEGSDNSRNGLQYYSSYVLGYQIPNSPVLQMLVFQAEQTTGFYDTPNPAAFGGNLADWTFSFMGNLRFTDWFSALAGLQLNTVKKFTNPEPGNLYFTERVIDPKNPVSLAYGRFAIIMTFKVH
jgi:hypothetical protein